jgi:hypothetical protein
MIIRDYNIINGRNFTSFDIQNGVNYAIIGDELKNNLFKNEDPM